MFYKKLFYYAKSVREKNSLRNLWRYLDFMVEKSAQPQFIQVNVDAGDGKLFRINDVSFGKYDGSVHLFIDLSQPMAYPEFCENVEWSPKPHDAQREAIRNSYSFHRRPQERVSPDAAQSEGSPADIQ